jgi:hypothetical protein
MNVALYQALITADYRRSDGTIIDDQTPYNRLNEQKD